MILGLNFPVFRHHDRNAPPEHKDGLSRDLGPFSSLQLIALVDYPQTPRFGLGAVASDGAAKRQGGRWRIAKSLGDD